MGETGSSMKVPGIGYGVLTLVGTTTLSMVILSAGVSVEVG